MAALLRQYMGLPAPAPAAPISDAPAAETSPASNDEQGDTQ
jgi:hypothetical protein